MAGEVRRFPDLEELNRDAAALFCEWVTGGIRGRGVFAMALSGGVTPRRLYERLARGPCDVRVPWSHVHLFWGDERWVPASHPDSNYGMAHEALIRKIAPPPGNVHRPPTDAPSPAQAAKILEEDMRQFFRAERQRDGFPVFDLVLLGVGADGHTASLFPGSPALEETVRWVVAVEEAPGEPRVPRLTLTLPVLNHARCVMFLVSGAGKKKVVREILEDREGAAARFPAARVHPDDGRLFWFLDGTFV